MLANSRSVVPAQARASSASPWCLNSTRAPLPSPASPRASRCERATSTMAQVCVPSVSVALNPLSLYGSDGSRDSTWLPPSSSAGAMRTWPSMPPSQYFGPPCSTS